MIKLINGDKRSMYTGLLREMHILRKEVFHDRLNWRVKIRDGMEIDNFDFCNPLYILSLEPTGSVRGCLRLLPTTGPNMLADIFKTLRPSLPLVQDPNIWESSRFCVRLRDGKSRKPGLSPGHVTAELIAAMGKVGLEAGLDKIVTVYDSSLRRIVRRMGCKEELDADPLLVDGVETYAGFFRINPDEIHDFCERWGVQHNLIDDDSSRRKILAA